MVIQARLGLAVPAALLALVAIVGCSPQLPGPATDPAPSDGQSSTQVKPASEAAPDGLREVAESFLSEMLPEDNIDSPAAWRAPDGATWLIATAKTTDQLVVYDGDTGATLQRIGRRGDGPGEFRRPNGVFVLDDLLLVVERDGPRVQVLNLPDFTSLGSFGNDVLIKPYGIWATRVGSAIEILVTDAYMAGEDEAGEDILPPLAELDRRLKRFSLRIADGTAEAKLSAVHGDTSPEGALRVVESLWGDPVHDRLLVAEEDETYANEFKVYHLNGRFSGTTFGGDILAAQAEGIALYACADGGGYWVTTEQGKQRSIFHLFERRSLEYVGAFSGKAVANTDGIWLQQAATQRFPSGALYAVHDDQGVVGFDWRAIVQALSLRECPVE